MRGTGVRATRSAIGARVRRALRFQLMPQSPQGESLVFLAAGSYRGSIAAHGLAAVHVYKSERQRMSRPTFEKVARLLKATARAEAVGAAEAEA